MASTFGWMLTTIYEVNVLELNYLIAGANLYLEKQNKEIEKSSKGGSKAGKFEVSTLSQLKNLPGVKVIKRNKP